LRSPASSELRFRDLFLAGPGGLISALNTALGAHSPRKSRELSSKNVGFEQTRFSEQVCAEVSKAREQSGFGGYVK
jgi:hypothetical protein